MENTLSFYYLYKIVNNLVVFLCGENGASLETPFKFCKLSYSAKEVRKMEWEAGEIRGTQK